MTVKQIIFYQLVEGETVVHVCQCPGDMVVRMQKVQAIINQGVRSMLPCFWSVLIDQAFQKGWVH